MDRSSVLEGLLSMQEKMDRVINEREAALQESDQENPDPTWWPQVDVFETRNAFVLEADLPGLTRENISVSVTNHNLVVNGERKRSHDINAQHHVKERAFGAFRRSFKLSGDVAQDEISAHFSNGVLEVIIPKESKNVNRRIAVDNER
ncbi:MAG: Hsp20/alpha crystallin family protein [Syntrophobacteria bacterium]